MKTTDTIYNQHAENKELEEKLFFYKDEIAIMQNRIAEVASKNSAKEVLVQIEHFQNQLIIQDTNIDMIKHDITLNEKSLANNVKKNKRETDSRKVKDHTLEREEVNTFEKNFNELRQELKKFLLKWM